MLKGRKIILIIYDEVGRKIYELRKLNFNSCISESRAYIVGSHDLYMKEASEVSFLFKLNSKTRENILKGSKNFTFVSEQNVVSIHQILMQKFFFEMLLKISHGPA